MGTLGVYVDDELEKRIRAEAAEERRSVSQHLRILLEDHYEAKDGHE